MEEYEYPAPATPPPGQQIESTHDVASLLHHLLEFGAAIIFLPLFLLALFVSAAMLYGAGRLWLIIIALPLSMVLADFITGVVHWAADTYCSEDTPIIGQSLIKPFRVHHVRPKEICEHGIVTTLGNTCILAVPLLVACLALMAVTPFLTLTAFAVFTTTVTVGLTVATNQFHKWAHEDAPSRVVRLLQSARLILSPTHHDGHHTEPFNMNYAITNGWLNRILNRTRFFRRVERALACVGIIAAGKRRDASATTEASVLFPPQGSSGIGNLDAR